MPALCLGTSVGTIRLLGETGTPGVSGGHVCVGLHDMAKIETPVRTCNMFSNNVLGRERRETDHVRFNVLVRVMTQRTIDECHYIKPLFLCAHYSD